MLDPTLTLTLTTHPDHLAAAEVVACRYTFDGRWLEQTRDGEWRDTMPRPDDERENEIARLRVNLEEANRKVIDLSDDRNAFKADASEWKRQYEAAKGRIREMEQRLARAEAIENVAWEVVRWMNPETEAIRGLRDRLWHALGDSAPVEVPEHGSSSDPCPDCGSSRWTPDGESYVFPYVLPPAKPKPDRSTGEGARQTASDGDAPVAVETEAEREVTRLREEVERWRQSYLAEKERADTWRSELGSWQKQNAELRTEVDSLRSQITRESWIEGNDALRKENERLRGECKRLASDSDQFGRCLGDTVTRLQAAHRELDSLRAQLAASQAEVERLKAEVQSAEQGESEANGVMDNIDTQVGDALESLGLDTLAGTGFPWRVDKLVEAAKEYKAEVERLAASLAASLDREAETARRCEAVVRACDKHLAYWSGFYRPDLVTLRQAVEDARRPATTEVRA